MVLLPPLLGSILNAALKTSLNESGLIFSFCNTYLSNAYSGLMNNDNIADFEANDYKYIIGAKIKNESRKIQEWILEQPKTDSQMVEYDKGNGQRLLVGYTEDRARKDAYNREKGIRRLEKA